MTPDEMNKLGKDSMETAMNSFGAWSNTLSGTLIDQAKKLNMDVLPTSLRLTEMRIWLVPPVTRTLRSDVTTQ